MNVYGLDVGGSVIKGAPVDMDTGELAGRRVKINTPKLAAPVTNIRPKRTPL